MAQFSDKYLAWFILKKVPHVGNRLFKQLISKFHSPDLALTAEKTQLESVPGITRQACKHILAWERHRDAAQRELDTVRSKDIGITRLTDPDFPLLLKEIDDPPPFMTYLGRLDPSTPCISMVGSRNATSYGLSSARRLSGRLASMGFTLVSGMARGIDTAAHKGALDAVGKTIAVLGSGLNQIYPKENAALFERIREKGAVMSEFTLDAPPLGRHFPIRNRIIAGMCVGTLVVEAAKRSGSLITARLANEYNREVFAVPGSIHSSKSQGTHFLLKQGAKLVENEMDIVDELSQFIHPALPGTSAKSTDSPGPKKTILHMDKDKGLVYKHLDSYPKHIDSIIESTGMDSGMVTATLLDLELSGFVQRHPGNFFSISEE